MGSVVDFGVARSTRIVRRALTQMQDALWANIPPTHNRSYAETIERIRRIVLSEEVHRALRCADEPVSVAYVDTIRAIVFSRAKPRTLVEELWAVLEQPMLNKVLGRRQKGPMTISYEPRWHDEQEGSWPPNSA
jgi:hypothetical protein